mmetsp:Transcript_4725/g.6892  ORF Transcript_4725/g.6892 Transcript_4725/m.6892 type:complete len:82 (-) Transcript_4725:44-289(-)
MAHGKYVWESAFHFKPTAAAPSSREHEEQQHRGGKRRFSWIAQVDTRVLFRDVSFLKALSSVFCTVTVYERPLYIEADCAY